MVNLCWNTFTREPVITDSSAFGEGNTAGAFFTWHTLKDAFQVSTENTQQKSTEGPVTNREDQTLSS